MRCKRFATFNCQRVLNKVKQMNIADEFCHHQLTNCYVDPRNSYMQGHGLHLLESSSGEKLHLHFSGHKNRLIAGTDIIVRPNSNVTFTPVTKRISMMKVKSNNNIITNIISAYAPTLESTLKNPETTHHFYENLSSIIKTFKTREAVIIGGEFNAKTNSKFNNFPTNIIGKYAKGEINVNDEKMIEFCIMSNLKVTKTFFKHKPIHLTTRQSPAPHVNITGCKTNSPRRNLFRNQIDYILVRNNTNTKVFDSKATISSTTNSDHKSVIAKIMVK